MAGYVELFRLGKSFPAPGGGESVVVSDFNLDIDEGEFVALLGHSGCGKSTVLSMVAGLTTPSAGSIAVARREIDGPGPDRGVVFQSPCLLPWFTALENVLLGVDRVFPHVPKRERREIGLYFLNLVGLGDAAERSAKELSQGMQQRVGIARAFAISPKMLLLDEPFGMLDSLTRMELQDVLQEILERERKTTLMVTHDVDEALYMSDRIVMMTSGPAARVGEILQVSFERPRDRAAVMRHPQYYPLRERMIEFLEEQDRHRPAAASEPELVEPIEAPTDEEAARHPEGETAEAAMWH